MSTQDDTYNRLVRTEFHIVFAEVEAVKGRFTSDRDELEVEASKVLDILSKHKWKLEEYLPRATKQRVLDLIERYNKLSEQEALSKFPSARFTPMSVEFE